MIINVSFLNWATVLAGVQEMNHREDIHHLILNGMVKGIQLKIAPCFL